MINTLQAAHFDAYLVGGCVRDLSLRKSPKDFDIATNATPEEVKALFHNCRLIGRRFRLAHVYFRREIIEVATFRGNHKPNKKTETHSEDGMIIRDNVFGSIEEDAYRRDFTINALYHNPADNTVLDYTGGMTDLKNKTLQIIGDAEIRYKEDPVRMLRAIRFMSKLDFTLSKKTEAPIKDLANLLSLVSPSRLFDESLKSFLHGTGLQNYLNLKRYHLFQKLIPALNHLLENNDQKTDQLIQTALKNTDERVHIGKSVTPAFLFSALLWYPIAEKAEKLRAKQKPLHALELAIDKILSKQIKTISIPRRFTNSMRDIWRMQYFLTHRTPRSVMHAIHHNRFRAAYDLMLIRNEVGEGLQSHCDWWANFQAANKETRNEMIEALKKR